MSDDDNFVNRSMDYHLDGDSLSVSSHSSSPSSSQAPPTSYLRHPNIDQSSRSNSSSFNSPSSLSSISSRCCTLCFIFLVSSTFANCFSTFSPTLENVSIQVDLVDDDNVRLQLALPTGWVSLNLRPRSSADVVHTLYQSNLNDSSLINMNRTTHRAKHHNIVDLFTNNSVDDNILFGGHVEGHDGTATVVIDCHGRVNGIVTSAELGGQIMIESWHKLACRWQRCPAYFLTTCAHSVSILQQKHAPANARRVRRSFSVERTIEVLMVTDASMQEFHGEKLRNYVLTLMAIVSHIFEHSSVGNEINIKVVRIDSLLDDSQEQLLGLAQNKLRRFCRWQHQHNYASDSHPFHHDTAMLLTRRDLCRSDWHHQEHRGKQESSSRTVHREHLRTPCDTLGLAHSGQICDPENSCGIVEDNGLSAAFTIAHELGHLLGVPHDDEEKCKAFYQTTEGQRWNASSVSNVMARMIDYNSYMWSWSPCSRYFLTEYLDAGFGNCLLDGNEPESSQQRKLMEDLEQSAEHGHGQRRSFYVANLYRNITPADFERFLPAGMHYDAHHQCELVFGKGSSVCPDMPYCSRLWCQVPGNDQGCRTQSMPWADGTPCGRSLWCRMGKCVNVSSITAVDGLWGPWSSYSECSLPCGGGIRRSHRQCDNPAPANGGRFCLGERVRYQSCNSEPCKENTVDLREQQCSAYNNQNFSISSVPANVTWVPHYTGIQPEDACKLYCADSSSGRYFPLKQRVIDGTPCTPDSYDVCVNGRCMPAGCDRVLGSGKSNDACGVCGGDNSTCHELSGVYRPQTVAHGYNFVVTIPPGGTNVEIRKERIDKAASNQSADNWLAMRADNYSYLLNGRFTVNVYERKWHYGGTVIHYSGASHNGYERLNTSRPLQRALHIEVLCVGDLHPPAIFYRYTMHDASFSSPSSTSKVPTVHYEWAMSNWTECSRACYGQQERRLICRIVATHQRETEQAVSEDHCQHLPKPDSSFRACRTYCQLDWFVVNDDQPCSSRCGPGWRKKEVFCRQTINSSVRSRQTTPKMLRINDSFCAHLARPSENEQCVGSDCSVVYQWNYDQWSDCQLSANVACGPGQQTRMVKCRKITFDASNELTNQTSENVVDQEEMSPEICRQFLPPAETEKSCRVDCPLQDYHRNNSLLSLRSDHTKTNPGVWKSGDWSSCHDIYEQVGKLALQLMNQFQAPKCFNSTEELNEFRDRNAMLFKLNDSLARSSYETLKEFNLDEQIMFRRRLVACVSDDDGAENFPPRCDPNSRPVDSDFCPLVDDGRQLVSMPTFSGDMCPTLTTNNTQPTTESVWPDWSDWGECQTRGICGNGSQESKPICSSHKQQCLTASKHRPCYKACKIFRWQVITDWSTCSVRCGAGVRQRAVVCLDFSGTKVSAGLCDRTQMPAREETCHANEDCRLVWRAGSWSECNQRCGRGFQSREVTCHRINSHGHLDPRPVLKPKALNRKKRKDKKTRKKKHNKKFMLENSWRDVSLVEEQPGGRGTRDVHLDVRQHAWCDAKTRPGEARICSRGACSHQDGRDSFVWTTTQWTECSASCGFGYEERRVSCHSLLTHEKVPRSLCEARLKPHRKRRCKLRECHVISCRDMRDRARILQDGDYEIWIQGARVRVYCYGMHMLETPLEYLPIASQVYADNFAQLTEKSRDCKTSSHDPQVSVIYFRSIRFNLTSLELIANDTMFSVLNDPRQTNSNAALVDRLASLTYGEAAFQGCPTQSNKCRFDRKSNRAMFSINLHGTGLVAMPEAAGKWTRNAPEGFNIDRHIKRSRNGEKVIGYCGLRSEREHQLDWTTEAVEGHCRMGCRPLGDRIALEVP